LDRTQQKRNLQSYKEKSLAERLKYANQQKGKADAAAEVANAKCILMNEELMHFREEVVQKTAQLEEYKELLLTANRSVAKVEKLQAHIDKLKRLAAAACNVMAHNRGLSKTGCRVHCSYEVLSGGRCGSVRKVVFSEEVTNGDGTVSVSYREAVVKVVDVSAMAVAHEPLNVLGAVMEPCHTAMAAAAFAELKRDQPWTAAKSTAAAAPGALDAGDLAGLVNSMELMFMPRKGDEAFEQALQQHLNSMAPRPNRKLTAREEFLFCAKRDALARVYQEQHLKEGGKGCELCLVMVQLLATQGSLEDNVLENDFHCDADCYGALRMDQWLFLMRVTFLQLDSLHKRNLTHRDIKSANVLLHDGMPRLADFDCAMSQVTLQWALDTGVADKTTLTSMWGGSPGYVVREVATRMGDGVSLDTLLTMHFARGGAEVLLMKGADAGGLMRTALDVWEGQCRWELAGGRDSDANCLLKGATSKRCRWLRPSEDRYATYAEVLASYNEVIPPELYCVMKTLLKRKAASGERSACMPQLLNALTEACQERAAGLGVSEDEYLLLQGEILRVCLGTRA
jgi:hypothetical protein